MTYKVDTEALCVQKTADFNVRQKLRGEDLEAIKKAMEIIGSGAVKGSDVEYLHILLQTNKSVLAKLQSSQQSPLQLCIADFLFERAHVTAVVHCRILG